MLKFVQHFDPIQIRYSGYEFRQLLQNVEIAAMSSFKVGIITPRSIDVLPLIGIDRGGNIPFIACPSQARSVGSHPHFSSCDFRSSLPARETL